MLTLLSANSANFGPGICVSVLVQCTATPPEGQTSVEKARKFVESFFVSDTDGLLGRLGVHPQRMPLPLGIVE